MKDCGNVSILCGKWWQLGNASQKEGSMETAEFDDAVKILMDYKKKARIVSMWYSVKTTDNEVITFRLEHVIRVQMEDDGIYAVILLRHDGELDYIPIHKDSYLDLLDVLYLDNAS